MENTSGSVAGLTIINVNTASVSELDELWGIGEVRAEDIVANSPYGSVDDLVTKAKIPQNVLEKNERKISVYLKEIQNSNLKIQK